MSEPTLMAISYDKIFDNPYQVKGDRRMKGPDFDDLVESIRVNGVQQPPPARPHPTIEGAVQLLSGHRRLAASKVACPQSPFRVVLKDATDIEMLEICAEENLHRSDLNDIERAQMIEAYKGLKPGATNADMARVFKLKDPASITNIRKLLKLPAPIQQLVAEDKIPDAYARQLVGVAAVNEKAAVKIAEEVAKAPRSEKAEVFEEKSRDLYWRNMRDLYDLWPLDWLADAPITVAQDLGDGEHIIGACAGCPFNVNGHCARIACWDIKSELWTEQEVVRVANAKKLATVADGETVIPLFIGHYQDHDRAAALLNAKKEVRSTLRAIPHSGNNNNYISRLLGSEWVSLGSVDKALCDQFLADKFNGNGQSKAVKIEKPDNETDAQKAKRIAQEQKEQERNREARSRMWKSYHDALWLLEHAANIVGAELVKSHRGSFVRFIEEEFCEHFSARLGADEISSRMEAEIERGGDPVLVDQLRLTRVALHVFAHSSIRESFSAAEFQREFSFESVHREIKEICAAKESKWGDPAFDIALPHGWDVMPVHQTNFNCWQCGTFAGNQQKQLTQRDIKEDGWIDDGKQGVFCSQEHKELYYIADAKAILDKAFEKEKSKKAKAVGNAKKRK